jgi:glyoxylase-like metal-dependent hydrolase (beta-lactamase superfamily II)
LADPFRLTLLSLLLALFMAPAAQATDPIFTYEQVKVAEGIHAFMETGRHAIVSGNSVAIVGEDAVLVVDTGHHPSLTKQMIADIGKLTGKPVQYVVNTHWHNDHVSGNFVYADAFPQAKFITHAFTAGVMAKDIRAYTGRACQAFLGSQARILKEMLDTNKDPEGNPLPPDRRARLEKVMREADAGMEECMEFRYVRPDITFTDSLTIDLGKRIVQLQFLGLGNTAGDVVVVVPDAKVAIVGDIVVYPFPFATQSYIGEWAAVLRKVIAMDTVAIVPGHGPVMRDKAYVTDMAELMESISAQVKAAYQPGMSFEDVRKKVDISKFRAKFAGDDKFIQANFDGMIGQSAIKRAWEEASGNLEREQLPPPE